MKYLRDRDNKIEYAEIFDETMPNKDASAINKAT